MTDEYAPSRTSQTEPDHAAPASRGRRGVLVALASLVLVAAGFSLWRTSGGSLPAQVPKIDATGVDPQVLAAIESAREAVLRRPTSGAAWGHLGMVLHAHEYYAEAISCYEAAQRLAPAQFRWPYYRGNLLEAGDREAAIEAFRQAVAVQPEIAQLRIRLGESLLDAGRRDDAQEQLEAALRLSPGSGQALFRMAQLALQRGDLQAARQWAEKAGAERPPRREVHELLAQVYHRLNDARKLEEQRARLRAGGFAAGYWRDPFFDELKRLRQDPAWLAFEANQRISAGSVTEGLAELEGLLAARPDDRAVREQLAHAYLRLDDLDSASRVLDEGLAVTPDYFPLHRLRGSVHMLGGEWEPGVVRFCDALSLKPDDPAAHSDLAYCFAQVRLFGPAIEEFREALRYRPEMVEARLHLAGLLLDRGDRDEAKRELETVLELSPQDPTAQALLKLASGKTGKPDLP